MVDSQKSEISHVSVNSKTQLKVDALVSSYEQVNQIGSALAHKFILSRATNKVVLNITDQFSTNNNCGFNLANFKPRFIRDYFKDVVIDYERSFIGSFASALFRGLADKHNEYEVFFTIAKFTENMGFSLTQNPDDSDQTAQNNDDL